MRLSELIIHHMPIKGVPDDAKKYIVARIYDDWLSYVNSFDNKDDALCYAEKHKLPPAATSPPTLLSPSLSLPSSPPKRKKPRTPKKKNQPHPKRKNTEENRKKADI